MKAFLPALLLTLAVPFFGAGAHAELIQVTSTGAIASDNEGFTYFRESCRDAGGTPYEVKEDAKTVVRKKDILLQGKYLCGKPYKPAQKVLCSGPAPAAPKPEGDTCSLYQDEIFKSDKFQAQCPVIFVDAFGTPVDLCMQAVHWNAFKCDRGRLMAAASIPDSISKLSGSKFVCLEVQEPKIECEFGTVRPTSKVPTGITKKILSSYGLSCLEDKFNQDGSSRHFRTGLPSVSCRKGFVAKKAAEELGLNLGDGIPFDWACAKVTQPSDRSF